MLDRIDLSEISFHFLSQTLQGNDCQTLVDLGFSPSEIEALEALTLRQLRHLSRLGPGYLLLKIDRECFCKALARVLDQQQDDSIQDQLIRQGAPAGMMKALFGLTKKELAFTRRQLGLGHPGRSRIPDDRQLAFLQRQWQRFVELPPPERYLAVARETGLSLASVWLVADQLDGEPVLRCRP